MDKNEIGINAGMVWRLLSDNCDWGYEELKRKSGLSDRDLNAAIGWLAHEDKIEIGRDGNNGEDRFHHPHYKQYY